MRRRTLDSSRPRGISAHADTGPSVRTAHDRAGQRVLVCLHWLILAGVTCLVAGGCAPSGPALREIDRLRQAPLHTFNEQELSAYLTWLHTQPMTPRQRVTHLARKNIGQPYKLFLLGEHPVELYDPDPMYCLSASDCVTFVEHTWAMALSRDWSSFFRTLQRIRYKNGKVGILTRNHFTTADWNPNNAWIFTDATRLLSAEATRPMRVCVDRAAFFAQYGLGQTLPIEIIETDYLPRDCLTDALDGVQDGDVVEIVKGGDEWQYVSHMGILLHSATGGVTIIHSTMPAVREEPLADYIENHPNILGLKILRPIPPAPNVRRSKPLGASRSDPRP